MANEIEMRMVDGWPLATIDGNTEPKIRDLDLAEKLGYERPRDIRRLIGDLIKEGKLKDVHERAVQVRQGFRDGEVKEYWLLEGQALKVSAKSKSEVADGILDDMIAVFMAYRRGQLPAGDFAHVTHRLDRFEPVLTAVQRASANPERFNPRSTVGDHPAMVRQVRTAIGELATARLISWQKAHGSVRVFYGVTSYKRVGQDVVWHLLEYLQREASVKLLPPPSRQLGMFPEKDDDEETKH